MWLQQIWALHLRSVELKSYVLQNYIRLINLITEDYIRKRWERQGYSSVLNLLNNCGFAILELCRLFQYDMYYLSDFNLMITVIDVAWLQINERSWFCHIRIMFISIWHVCLLLFDLMISIIYRYRMTLNQWTTSLKKYWI